MEDNVVTIEIDRILKSKYICVDLIDTEVNKAFITQFRMKNNLSQCALANILGVNTRTVMKWEKGSKRINKTAAILLKLLDTNPELLSQLYNIRLVEDVK